MTSHRSLPAWSTACFGGSADTSPMELHALGEHLSRCRTERGRLHALRNAGRRVHAYAAARLVSTLLLATFLLFGISALL